MESKCCYSCYFFSEDDSELKSCVRNSQNVTHKALRVRGVGELLKSPVADGGG